MPKINIIFTSHVMLFLMSCLISINAYSQDLEADYRIQIVNPEVTQFDNDYVLINFHISTKNIGLGTPPNAIFSIVVDYYNLSNYTVSHGGCDLTLVIDYPISSAVIPLLQPGAEYICEVGIMVNMNNWTDEYYDIFVSVNSFLDSNQTNNIDRRKVRVGTIPAPIPSLSSTGIIATFFLMFFLAFQYNRRVKIKN